MKFVTHTGISKRTCSEACSHPVTNNYSRGSHRHLRRGAGLSPSTERHSASQATSGSENSLAGAPATLWPEEPRSRSYKLGTFTTAPPAKSCRHLRPGMWSPVSLRRDSRPSNGSAALTFPTSGFSTERVGGPHA